MNRAVFLDRDNTLIPNDGDLGDPTGVRLMQGVATAVASLRGLGYRIVVVTNQGGVARGRYGEADVDAVHQRLSALLQTSANGAIIDRYYFCPFHPEGTVPRYRREHPWRKPQPGMMLQAAEDLKLDLSLSWMVGDQLRDIEAGKAAGLRTVLVGDREADAVFEPHNKPDFVAHNLVEAARVIAQQIRPEAAAGGRQPPSTGRDPALGAEPEQGPSAEAPPSRPGMTYPAVEKLHSGIRREPGRAHKPRPFKPWDIQPRTEEDEAEAEPQRSTRRMTEPTQHGPPPEAPPQAEPSPEPASQPESKGEADPQPTASNLAATPSPEPEPAPGPPTAPRPPEPPGPGASDPSAKRRTDPPPEPRRLSQPQPPADEPDPTMPTDTRGLLSQILRELRQLQMHRVDWSLSRTLALAVVQPAAGICAIVGLLSAGSDSLLAWLGGAILLQLLVVTLLIVDRH